MSTTIIEKNKQQQQQQQQHNYGYLVVFGKNSHGQIGIKIDKDFIYNQDNYTAIPTLLSMPVVVVKVSCGVAHTGFITLDRSLYMMGNGSFGKLGLGDTEDRMSPANVSGIPPVVDIQCGNDHTIALSLNLVYTWGSGSLGRLGLTGKNSQWTPQRISTLSNVESVYAGGASSGAITRDGKLYTWGYNKYGQLGVGDLNDKFAPVAVTFFNKVVIKSFAIGDRHMAALDEHGDIYTWGMNEDGQLGDGSTFNKSLPTLIRVKPFQPFSNIQCGGAYTCVVGENGSFWCWGAFVDEYSSKTPKCLIESSIVDFDCSSDCGRHVLARTDKGEVYAFGWNRYGQAANENEECLDTVPISRADIMVGYPNQLSTGSYHSAAVFNNPSDLLAQLLWTGTFEQIHSTFRATDSVKHIQFRNYNGDSLLHLIAKKKYNYNDVDFLNGAKDDLSLNFQTLNNEKLPPFFYNAELLEWPIQKTAKTKSDISFIHSATGDNCLHYFAKKGLYKDFEIAIKMGADHKLRNKQAERPFDLIEKGLGFEIKERYQIYDIGIVYTGEYINLANRLKQSLKENHITSCLIDKKTEQNRDCYGYIFFVSSSSLSTGHQVEFLLTFISKSPMVSIWAEKTKITDPTLESCIFRSQLVDFSSHSMYEESFSVLMEGVYNMFAQKDKSGSGDDDDDDNDNKNDVDTIPHSISGSTESIFISFDPNNQHKFSKLFQFFKDNNITIVPREKKVISSWVVIVVISDAEFTPLIRDEISLAENRGKPLIPIYYTDKILDEASRYTFSNSPKIAFNDNGFQQLLLLIKLNFNLIHQSEKLININKK